MGGLFRITVIMLASFFIGVAHAVGSGQESDLIALSDAWIDAEVHHDKAALERLLDERFLATLTSGKTVDRTAFIERIMATEIKPFEVLNEVVNVHGDAALIISTTTDRTTKFTWVAVKKGGEWRVISETFSKITTPTPTATLTPTTTLTPRATPVQRPRSTPAPPP